MGVGVHGRYGSEYGGEDGELSRGRSVGGKGKPFRSLWDEIPGESWDQQDDNVYTDSTAPPDPARPRPKTYNVQLQVILILTI